MLDKQTPTGGDRMDILPPSVGGGHYGQPQELSYTEKVRGSSPFAPAHFCPGRFENLPDLFLFVHYHT